MKISTEMTLHDLQSRAHQAAQRYCEKKGMSIVASGFVCPAGQFDLIVNDGETLVFVEVRAMTEAEAALGANPCSDDKRARLTETALAFMDAVDITEVELRFDVIGYLAGSNGRGYIKHFTNTIYTDE